MYAGWLPRLSASFFFTFHRESVDSDLLFSDIIGREAFQQIEREVLERFGESVIGLDYPCDEDDQFVFLRFYIRNKGKWKSSRIWVCLMILKCWMTFAY